MKSAAQNPLITTIRIRQARMIRTITALIREMGSVRSRAGFSRRISQSASVVSLVREYHLPRSLSSSSVSALKEYRSWPGDDTSTLLSLETLSSTWKKSSGSSVMLMQFSE